MIFVQSKTGNSHSKLGIALGVSSLPENNEKGDSFEFNKTNTQMNKPIRPILKKNENLIRSPENSFFQKTQNKFNFQEKKTKPSMLNSINLTGCAPYDPYLIHACKEALIYVKKELPNYQEIINKINKEFGIEEEPNNLYSEFNHTCRSFSNNKFMLTKYSNLNNNFNNTVSFQNYQNNFINQNNQKKNLNSKEDLNNIKINQINSNLPE